MLVSQLPKDGTVLQKNGAVVRDCTTVHAVCALRWSDEKKLSCTPTVLLSVREKLEDEDL